MKRTPPYTPFKTNLSVLRSSGQKLNQVDVVTNIIRSALDQRVNDVGFVSKPSRFQASFNRFLKCYPKVYPVSDKEYVEQQWKLFKAQEVRAVKLIILDFCVLQNLVHEDMREKFWITPEPHTRLPKEYESVQNFAKALLDYFQKSEYCDFKNGEFYDWIDELEADTAKNVPSEKLKEVKKKSVRVVKAEDTYVITDDDEDLLIQISGISLLSNEATKIREEADVTGIAEVSPFTYSCQCVGSRTFSIDPPPSKSVSRINVSSFDKIGEMNREEFNLREKKGVDRNPPIVEKEEKAQSRKSLRDIAPKNPYGKSGNVVYALPPEPHKSYTHPPFYEDNSSDEGG